MDSTTTISDQTISLENASGRMLEHAADLGEPIHHETPTTIENESQPIETTSSTNSLPETILRSWSKIALADMSVGMSEGLVRIATNSNGWRGPGSLSLRAESLESFLEFWSTIRDDALEPELALAPDGTLHAEWFRSQRQRLDVRFAEHNVVFGLFANNSILEGVERLQIVASFLKLHPEKPLKWSAR